MIELRGERVFKVNSKGSGSKLIHFMAQPTFTCSKSKQKTRTMCEICSKLTIKTQKDAIVVVLASVFIVNFEKISRIVLVFLFLTLNK